MNAPEAVLAFWFGDAAADDAAIANRQASLWWGKSSTADATIRREFGVLVEAAARGSLNHWAATDTGLLALMLLIDQFRRNLYRDSAEAFALDDVARGLTRQSLRRGGDQRLRPIHRVFVYLPLEHSESLADQEDAVALYRRLATGVPPEQRKPFDGFVDFALAHHELIAAYGRFPHRNRALGRVSSAAEQQYLARPGAGF